MIDILNFSLSPELVIASHILLLAWFHFLGDFAFQIDDMAINKSSSFKWLSIHVGVYSLPLIVFGWQFAVVNFVLHWITDAITSRISGAYAKAGNIRMQFFTIGLDQAIHMTCLIGTYVLFFVV